MKKAGTYATSQIGFTGLLTIIFIILKLTGTITWSWIWVLCPFWISLILGLLIYIFIYIVARRIISAIFNQWRN